MSDKTDKCGHMTPDSSQAGKLFAERMYSKPEGGWGHYEPVFVDGLYAGKNRWVPASAATSSGVKLAPEPAFRQASIGLSVDGESGDMALEHAFALRLCDLFDLFKARQRKYGPSNIAVFGSKGVAVRAHDKLARLHHYYFGAGGGDMADESVDDAWADLAVYAAIALVCRNGDWPGCAEGDVP